ncbi:Barnase inhibitor [Pseudomonas cichorii]|uniref:Barnase inhibitor n=1 Tax=Pseudomonas cichorii TaxID=36746 RepID=A0A3M4LMT8_PSECI|nr:barstar family protein [Pseudomonas cichorii]RMQ42680.1 Barnase inhibitor [Pseudomonas cichorii]
MTPFTFVDGVAAYDTSKVFYARLEPGISDSDYLLRAISALLWFPGYFGMNWNALYDCLRDFEWIPCTKVVLVHEALPKIPEAELKVYLEVLSDAVLDWREGEEHSFEVVFPESERSDIERFFAQA